MADPVLKKTLELGQSIWLDFISRELMATGELDRLIGLGLRGMTSNPTIFEGAVRKSSDYDPDILMGLENKWSPTRVFEHLASSDVRKAADRLRPVYDASHGTDGFVSLECSPLLANDMQATLEEARRLWKAVDRPNCMIKIAGTDEGMEAIRTMLEEGANINITLLFSIEQYRQVLEIYQQAMEKRVERGLPVKQVASVASFFVSRVDSSVDKQLEGKGRKDLMAKAAIANACLAYRHFEQELAKPRWKKLAAAGVQVQRPLWASTSTKNPEYSDVLYVHELMAPHTVNTLPPQTLEAWMDHGKPELRLRENMREADRILEEIAKLGISLEKVTRDLIADGVQKFTKSFEDLLDAIETKMKSGVPQPTA